MIKPRISVKLPLEIDPRDGPYKSLDDLVSTVRQNFKNLILTIPGERVMMPDFGVGVHQYLFENASQETVDLLRQQIIKKTAKYFPFISIRQVIINFAPDENSLLLRIEYFISKINEEDMIEILVNSPI